MRMLQRPEFRKLRTINGSAKMIIDTIVADMGNSRTTQITELQLSELNGISLSTVTKQMRLLESLGVISREREGIRRTIRLRKGVLNELE